MAPPRPNRRAPAAQDLFMDLPACLLVGCILAAGVIGMAGLLRALP